MHVRHTATSSRYRWSCQKSIENVPNEQQNWYPFFVCCARHVTDSVYVHVHRYYVNWQSLLSDFNQTWIFSAEFHKRVQYQISSNPSSGTRQPSWYRQKDMTKQTMRTRLQTNQKPQLVESRYLAKCYPFNEPRSGHKNGSRQYAPYNNGATLQESNETLYL
jgi:hypothetical protein